MKSFIYDKYGYYVDDDTTKFDYKDWHFELELTKYNESELLNMKTFLKEIPTYFSNLESDIVFSRDNKLLQESIYGNVCLVATKKKKISIDELISFPLLFSFMAENKSLKISQIKQVWINKVDKIEEKILTKVKIDDFTYKLLMELYIFNAGLAETAIQYLADTIYLYGDNVEETSLTHKRIKDFSSYTFLNPLNFIVDFKYRDISELIKNDLISFDELKNKIIKLNLSSKNASLILARLLYPTDLYDVLEEFYLIKKDVSKEIYLLHNNINKKIEKIKKVYNLFINLYKIKPINWLDTI